ncbi:hypothetical protein EV363DRAFT_1371167 [Boletus edulis]|uniref:G domain-containing protein n=1 Tax=Boletus edulis BED1 TaxID=1328754 RepID=A0AAD4BD49_BOLED|nr:hypothetical protein EV363DRAFT_1371167 [Boletus edulis]KAF8420759.1 hypothetical protein L210DRAFT_938088 [Boletus edulis BED1]
MKLDIGMLDWIKGLHDLAFQLGDHDIVVFVVGPSGSGKSTFVEQATKSAFVNVGTSLRPCTATVQAIRCELTDRAKAALGATMQRNIVFVDTPSFHTQAGRQDEAAESVKSWLKNSKSDSTPSLVGTIYMHRVETDPRYESVQQHLNTFAHTFPNDFVPFPQRLHTVFSYEGVIPDHTIQPRRERFEAQLRTLRPSLGQLKWDTSFHPALFRQGDPETAWQAVVALFTLSQS